MRGVGGSIPPIPLRVLQEEVKNLLSFFVLFASLFGFVFRKIETPWRLTHHRINPLTMLFLGSCSGVTPS
jgi:hypothetical protein